MSVRLLQNRASPSPTFEAGSTVQSHIIMMLGMQSTEQIGTHIVTEQEKAGRGSCIHKTKNAAPVVTFLGNSQCE